MRFLLCTIVMLTLVVGLDPRAQEKIVLDAPVRVLPGAAFRVWLLEVRRDHPDSPARIFAIYRELADDVFVPEGRALYCRYEGAEAETLIIALNTADLRATSLEKRIIQKCQSDGKLGAGTITGVPK